MSRLVHLLPPVCAQVVLPAGLRHCTGPHHRRHRPRYQRGHGQSNTHPPHFKQFNFLFESSALNYRTLCSRANTISLSSGKSIAVPRQTASTLCSTFKPRQAPLESEPERAHHSVHAPLHAQVRQLNSIATKRRKRRTDCGGAWWQSYFLLLLPTYKRSHSLPRQR